MNEITGCYVGYSADELAEMKAEFTALRTAIATGHQGYSRPGLAVTRANLKDVLQTLAEIRYAEQVASGGIVTETLADLSA